MSFPPPPPSPNDPPAPGPWQAAQPAGWQPPRPVEPTPEPVRGWVLPTVAIASVVTIGAVFAASAARESENSTDAATEARDAVVRLTDAMYQGDCAGVEAASTGGYFRSMNLTCDDIAGNGQWMSEVGMSFVIGEADLDGDTADVPVQIVVTSDPTQNSSGYFTVVRTGESWRVSNDQVD